MRFVTSFSRKLYEDYAHRLVETAHRLPGELIIYSEDRIEGLKTRNLHQLCPRLEQMKVKLKDYKPQRWEADVLRFANKAFALAHGMYGSRELSCWIDADCIVHKEFDEKFIKDLLNGAYCGYFGRTLPPYTETGFIAFDCAQPQNDAFIDAFRRVYVSGKIFSLPQWHDCYAFDHAREGFENFRNLSTKDVSHPIAVSPLGAYIDHCKGPKRKQLGYSPERPALLGDDERWSPGVTVRDTGTVPEVS